MDFCQIARMLGQGETTRCGTMEIVSPEAEGIKKCKSSPVKEMRVPHHVHVAHFVAIVWRYHGLPGAG